MKLLTAVTVMTLALTTPAGAYLQFAVDAGGRTVSIKWADEPVRWFATERGVAGVSPSQFQSAVSRAFATWQAVPTASVEFQFAGFVRNEPFEDDDVTVLGFQDHPEMDRVLGATSFLIDEVTGEILEADVFFNSFFPWSTAANGESDRVDLESIALHEIGHVVGLGHSALGETEVRAEGGRRVLASGAVMFPIAFARGTTLGRALQPDDIAGVSDLYPDNGFSDSTGTAQGRVVRNGNGVFGAHVVAFNPRTGALISGFTFNRSGEFQISGLSPGSHVIRVEPLDDADPDSFFESSDAVDTNFRVAFYERLFAAPAGGAGEPITIAVRPK